jgi:hypothetical protein
VERLKRTLMTLIGEGGNNVFQMGEEDNFASKREKASLRRRVHSGLSGEG